MSDLEAPAGAAPTVRCSACSRTFTVAAHYAHRVGRSAERRCLTEIELARDGFAKDERGVWRAPSLVQKASA